MAHDAAVHLTALSAVVSFLWVSSSIPTHGLVDRPRLSAFLVLTISGALCFVASRYSAWLPQGEGRFKKKDAPNPIRPSKPPTPRPRRYFLPVIVGCVVVRLELVYYALSQQQCTTPGIELFLCLALACYEAYAVRRPLPVDADDDNDPWGSLSDDIRRFFSGHTASIASLIAVLALCDGAFLAVSAQAARSTYFCSAVNDSAGAIKAAQVFGLFLDATVVVLAWRVLAWTKTTKARLAIIGNTLLSSAVAVAMVGMSTRMFGTRISSTLSAPRYAFEVFTDGTVFGVFIISTLLFLCETTPTVPVSVVTLIIGASQALHNVKVVGDWRHLYHLDAILPLYLCVAGFITTLYVDGTRSVVFMRRGFLVFCLGFLVVYASLASLYRPTHVIASKHPVHKLISDARVTHDRWLRKAGMSMRPEVAADEYRRRSGRDPPPNFDKWFQYALDHKSPVLDDFDQITNDFMPFWGLDLKDIRERVRWALETDSVEAITITNHKATFKKIPDAAGSQTLSDLVVVIQAFAEFLPDMVIPINLNPSPRILPTWDERTRLLNHAHTKHKVHSSNLNTSPTSLYWSISSPRDLIHAHSLACPPTYPNPTWNVRDSCAACAGPNAQFVSNWTGALDTCVQPDLVHLHSFFSSPSSPLHRYMVPLFSAAKTSAYGDILIPFPEVSRDTGWKPFATRRNSIHWRPTVDPNLDVRGDQVHRLLHMANNASDDEIATVLLPQSFRSANRFEYTPMTLRAASAALPLDVALGGYLPCISDICARTALELGHPLESNGSLPLHTHRFILVVDAPTFPNQLAEILRSSSVPIISTIFSTWMTSRIFPWIHFIPLDVRFHGFHSTAAYFVGMRGHDATRREMIERETGDRSGSGMGDKIGENPRAVGNVADGEWIANQGKGWAESALRQEDRRVYLFRVLLEWGRVWGG